MPKSKIGEQCKEDKDCVNNNCVNGNCTRKKYSKTTKEKSPNLENLCLINLFNTFNASLLVTAK